MAEMFSQNQNEIFYVHAAINSELPAMRNRVPSYFGFNSKEREKTWFPVSEEQYNNSVKILRRLDSEIKPTEIFPNSDGIEHFLINGCYVRTGKKGIYHDGEMQRIIGIHTEQFHEDRIKNLAIMLELPFQKSEGEIIQEEISRSGWTEPRV